MKDCPDADMPKADKHANATIRTWFEEKGPSAFDDFDDKLERPLPPGVIPGDASAND